MEPKMLDSGGIALDQINPLKEVVARELFSVWGITVSNHMFMVTLAAVMLIVLLPLAVRGKGLVRRDSAILLRRSVFSSGRIWSGLFWGTRQTNI